MTQSMAEDEREETSTYQDKRYIQTMTTKLIIFLAHAISMTDWDWDHLMKACLHLRKFNQSYAKRCTSTTMIHSKLPKMFRQKRELSQSMLKKKTFKWVLQKAKRYLHPTKPLILQLHRFQTKQTRQSQMSKITFTTTAEKHSFYPTRKVVLISGYKMLLHLSIWHSL